MNNLSLSQQAAASANISTSMPDIPSGEKGKPGKGRFKGKIAKAVSGARKRAPDKGSIRTGSSALKKPLKQLREAGEQGFRKLASKGYLDSETAESLYSKNIPAFARHYQDALNAYVQKNCLHYQYLKGYLAENPEDFVFRLPESAEDEPAVTVTQMRPTFEAFAEEIASLLEGHGSAGTLAKELIKSLEPLGLSLSPAMTTRTWSVYMKAPGIADSSVQPETACDNNSPPGVSQFQRTDSEERLRNKALEEKKIKEENLKKELAGNIQRLRQENGLAFDKCTITRRVAEEIVRFDACWQEPVGLSDYREFHVASTADDLEKLSLEMLVAEENSLKFKNQKLQEYIALIWESFPVLSDQRQCPLVQFKDHYSVKEVLTEATAILDQPALQTCRSGGLLKSRLFASRYAREQEGRESMLDDLQHLNALGESLKGFDSLAQAAENSAWFMNLVGECLRKGMPQPVLTLGKIKTSSDFRKTWKEKLEQWGIERIDKPSPALQEQPAMGQLAE
ncbi:hypothetical protein ACTL6P_02670 [Endozoicomonas acroporae]|uniref:hypothetical protein n=1 Tax=Endozoicomonas acroporae TaxID=1701104 RepID=UPI000C767270|nr:hypothetical protein [Endozoicomonas acroporae]